MTVESSFRYLHDAESQWEGGPIIACDGLVKIYQVVDLQVVALQGLDLHVEAGEFIAIVGASGSGKSTLLNILGGLDEPSAGRASVAGNDLMGMTDEDRTRYRRQVIGFMWQQTGRNLLPYLSAVENVEMPMILKGSSNRRERALELLELVGLENRAGHRPAQLSGGEQQRVAVAVALANEPAVVLADEPTGELDTATAVQVFEVLADVADKRGVTIVVVTHDPLVADHASRTVAIRDGRTSTETLRSTHTDRSGNVTTVQEEFVVLDRSGRLQLPEQYVDYLRLERRVRLTLDDDHARIWPDRKRAVGRYEPEDEDDE
jgi:putative ABC transport system ATP-binding protein